MHYMQAGWRIIPLHRVGPDGKTCSCRKGAGCRTPGKHPKSDQWQQAAPMSAADVYSTWDIERPPNLGVVTGEPSGFWVLDIDGPTGRESMTRLIADYAAEGAVPKTLLHVTGGAGYHFIFSLPAGFQPRTMTGALKELGYPGIDVRGVGGQIVLPPSRSDKGSYAVKRDADILAAPQWLLDIIPQVTADVKIELDDEDLAEYESLTDGEKQIADRYIDRAVAGVVQDLEALTRPWTEGAGWDQGVYKAACRLFELAQQSWSKLTYREAFELLDGHAPQDAEWGKTEINEKWNSAQNTVGKKPMPRPKGKTESDTDWRMDAWGFEDKPRPKDGEAVVEKGPADSLNHGRRLWVKFKADDAFTEPDIDDKTGKPKGKPQFQAQNVAKAIRSAIPLAHGADGVLWAHSDGRWAPHPEIVGDSLAATLGNAADPIMIGKVNMQLGPMLKKMIVGPTPDVINFRNGMLDWKTMELKKHDPAKFSTVQLPHNWNPDAECPAFDQFLAESLPPAGVKLAWEILAVALYSGNPIQRAVMLYGPPASGKSVFLDVVGNLLGQENVARVTLQGLSGRFNTAELYGRAANICADIDATKITETGTFKLTSVNDEIQAERKNKDPFRFVSFAMQLYSANTIPASDDRTGAWTRRWALLHFPWVRPVEKRVLGYQDVLLQEAEGIIAKAVRLIEGVLIQKDYSLIAEDQAEFERKTNYIIQFIEDELVRGDMEDELCFTSTQEAQWRYERWAREEGYEHPASWKKVAETLTQQGFKSTQKRLTAGKARVWRGFTLQYRAPLNASATDPYDV